jgi:hypothetical protein
MMEQKNKRVFRIRMDNEDLLLAREALLFYSKKLESERPGQPGGSEYDKTKAVWKLCFNFKLLATGERTTGRRRKFYPWKDTL